MRCLGWCHIIFSVFCFHSSFPPTLKGFTEKSMSNKDSGLVSYNDPCWPGPKRKQSSNHRFSGVMLASGRGKYWIFPSRMVGQKAEVTGISGMNGTYSRPYCKNTGGEHGNSSKTTNSFFFLSATPPQTFEIFWAAFDWFPWSLGHFSGSLLPRTRQN